MNTRGGRTGGWAALLGCLSAAYVLGGTSVANGDGAKPLETDGSLTDRLRQAPPPREHPELKPVSRSGALQTLVPDEHLDALLNKYSLAGCRDDVDQSGARRDGGGGGRSAPHRCLFDAQDSYDRQAQRHYLTGPDEETFGIGQHPSAGATPGGAAEGLTDRVALRLTQLLAASQSPWLQTLLLGRISFDVPLGKRAARATESPQRPYYRVVYEGPPAHPSDRTAAADSGPRSQRGKMAFAVKGSEGNGAGAAPADPTADQALMVRQWILERRLTQSWVLKPLSPAGAEQDPVSTLPSVSKRLVEVLPETTADSASYGANSYVGDAENQGLRHRLSRTLGLDRPVFESLSATVDRGSGAPRPEDVLLTVAEASASIVFVEVQPLRWGQTTPTAPPGSASPLTTGVTIPYRAHRAVLRTHFDQRPASISWEHRVHAATMGLELIPASESLKFQAQFDL